jgi:hypothetical protein
MTDHYELPDEYVIDDARPGILRPVTVDDYDLRHLPVVPRPTGPAVPRPEKTTDPDRVGVPWPDWVIALGKMQIGFWLCPAGHSDTVGLTTEERAAHRARNSGTVEWRDGIARCLHPDCGRTSADA